MNDNITLVEQIQFPGSPDKADRYHSVTVQSTDSGANCLHASPSSITHKKCERIDSMLHFSHL